MVTTQTSRGNEKYLSLDKRFVNPVTSRYWPVVAQKGAGSYLWDSDGTAYLDFTSGIAANNLGHCHPAVVEAVRVQAEKLMHVSVVTHHERYIELAQKLAEISPGRLESVFLANTGAEVVEGSLKLARYVTGRPAVIAFQGAFHGRTFFATALTSSKLDYRERYEPLPGPVFTAPFPYLYRSGMSADPEACVEFCLGKLEALFHQFVSPEQVAAIIVEPVQGEGGYIIPPASFLTRLRAVAERYKILLIVDEVQTGFGRTGRMFANEYSGIEPDVMLMAKGIASGMPVAAFITRSELSSQWKEGRHGSTFGGNPLSCAAALTTIDVIKSERLPERAARLGAEALARLKGAVEGKPHVAEVRGLGFMIAVEFKDKDGNPCGKTARKVAQRCFEEKMLTMLCGSHGQAIRLVPALNVPDGDLDRGLTILEHAMSV